MRRRPPRPDRSRWSQVWAEVLGAEGLTAAQMLVTLDDLEHRRRYLQRRRDIDRLLSLGVMRSSTE
ncbi:hypothetical protein OVY29_11710 [Sphingopyxis sp. SE2]|uniref:hypothetical protein n=1 Tax=Sphingopyxis sp. SE2 TaxID=1586240 RepID=UPI0028C31AE3|nr:hypothetical protein [Sphingopyxis sp. SE2]MDT7529330.1 hypothetical protein [Sphingopyxis sp. SE2]